MHFVPGLQDRQLLNIFARTQQRHKVSHLASSSLRQQVCAARAGTAEPDVSRHAAPAHVRSWLSSWLIYSHCVPQHRSPPPASLRLRISY